MIKMCTVCGMGLGSSLIIELNIKDVLKKLGQENKFEVTHLNLNSYSPSEGYDYIISGSDIADQISAGSGQKVILTNIMDDKELEAKIKEIIKKEGL